MQHEFSIECCNTVLVSLMISIVWKSHVDVQARHAKRGSFPVSLQAASDMWAVGALAWELLTGRPLFGEAFSDEDVVMALLGFKPLPFEADPSLWVLFTESQVSCMCYCVYL